MIGPKRKMKNEKKNRKIEGKKLNRFPNFFFPYFYKPN